MRRLWSIYDQEDEYFEVIKAVDEGELTVYAAWKKIKGIVDKETKCSEKKAKFMEYIARIRRTSVRERLLEKYSNNENIRKTTMEELRREVHKLHGEPIGETSVKKNLIIKAAMYNHCGLQA